MSMIDAFADPETMRVYSVLRDTQGPVTVDLRSLWSGWIDIEFRGILRINGLTLDDIPVEDDVDNDTDEYDDTVLEASDTLERLEADGIITDVDWEGGRATIRMSFPYMCDMLRTMMGDGFGGDDSTLDKFDVDMEERGYYVGGIRKGIVTLADSVDDTMTEVTCDGDVTQSLHEATLVVIRKIVGMQSDAKDDVIWSLSTFNMPDDDNDADYMGAEESARRDTESLVALVA